MEIFMKNYTVFKRPECLFSYDSLSTTLGRDMTKNSMLNIDSLKQVQIQASGTKSLVAVTAMIQKLKSSS